MFAHKKERRLPEDYPIKSVITMFSFASLYQPTTNINMDCYFKLTIYPEKPTESKKEYTLEQEQIKINADLFHQVTDEKTIRYSQKSVALKTHLRSTKLYSSSYEGS